MVIDWEMRPRQTLETKLNLSPHILKENQQTRWDNWYRETPDTRNVYWTLNPERDIGT